MKTIYLCHKCSGLLGSTDRGQDCSALRGCRCISGWIRDWQVPVTLEEAIADQKRQKEAMAKWKAERDAALLDDIRRDIRE